MRFAPALARVASAVAGSSFRPATRVVPAFTPRTAVPTLRPFSTTLPALKKGGKGGKGGKADKADEKSAKAASKGGKGGKGGKGKEDQDVDAGLSAEERTAHIKKAEAKMDKAISWARGLVFEGVERGKGRVSPALLDGIKVILPDKSAIPLNSIASITTKGNTLQVEVWDHSQTKDVDMALNKANLPGMSVQRDGNSLIRLPVSRPTGEVRSAILKTLSETVETAKNQVRVARTEGLKALGGRGEEGADEVQKSVENVTAELEKLLRSAKEEFEH